MKRKSLDRRFKGTKNGYEYQIDLVLDNEANKKYYNGYVKLLDEHELPENLIEKDIIKVANISYDSVAERGESEGRWIGFTMYNESKHDSLESCKYIIDRLVSEISTYGTDVKNVKEVNLSLCLDEGVSLIYEDIDTIKNKKYLTRDELVDLEVKCYVEATVEVKQSAFILCMINMFTDTSSRRQSFIKVPLMEDNPDARYNEAVDLFSESFDNLIKSIEEEYSVKIKFTEDDYNYIQDNFIKNMEIEM